MTTVMVSYQWDSQPLALKVREELAKAGITVLIDVGAIKGDFLQWMADSVRAADAVLLVMTKSYEQSTNCAAEAKLAHELKKEIIPLVGERGYIGGDGWLRLITAGKIRYDILDDFEQSLSTIIYRELRQIDDSKAAAVAAIQVASAEERRTLSPNDEHIRKETEGRAQQEAEKQAVQEEEKKARELVEAKPMQEIMDNSLLRMPVTGVKQGQKQKQISDAKAEIIAEKVAFANQDSKVGYLTKLVKGGLFSGTKPRKLFFMISMVQSKLEIYEKGNSAGTAGEPVGKPRSVWNFSREVTCTPINDAKNPLGQYFIE
ncbi:MAG TPA: toll/interleukin-1 receptor domain-containing protein, partial [Blastocatellia bacterium]|nr:toll/interleukin-1 receptor domain-containing protein [Blastocatellia bacterium]